MHALHSLAHRAPPATRTRVRWQPYTSISAASCASIPSRPLATYLITPAASVSSSPPIATPSSDLDHIRQSLSSSNPQILKDFPFRDPSRNKYAIGLVDLAVKSLCEIWQPLDIPCVFLSSSRAMPSVATPHQSTPATEHKPPKRRRNSQLPSPISPSTQASPPSPLASVPPPVTLHNHLSDQDMLAGSDPRDNLVPIKGFVHEVLRRSRTSGCVLQTALCYLEALRPKIPEIARQEKAGSGQLDEPSERITMATEAELQASLDDDSGFSINWDSIIDTEKCLDQDIMPTVRVNDDLDDAHNSISGDLSQDYDVGSKPHLLDGKSSFSTATPPLPSPLLCPRRAFLASLILASKFTQDKCYSNRAWAKLSGLPPREIGRCERALGEALEWRLWVGKRPVSVQLSSPPAKRPVVRCQSESSLLQSASNRTAFLVWNEKSTPSAAYPSPSHSLNQGGLRRCATLPAEVLTTSIPEHVSSDKTMVPDPLFDQNDMSDQTPSPTSSITSISSSSTYASSSTEKMSSSPSPPTPSLTYSPSSTESSSGDRTIQMSTFSDDSMACNASYRGTLSLEMRSWLDNPDGKVSSWKDSTWKDPPWKDSSSTVRHYPVADKMPPVFDHPFTRSFGEDSASPCKAPPPFDLDPASHMWASDTTLLTCLYRPD